ncbi:MAG: recombination regulator RecX [Nitrospirae bacterium]|nr:recombination regulator RecX [Nitrospirota bacterium]
MVKVLEDNLKSALKYAFKLLGYRDRSRKELYDRLVRKGFSQGVAEETVSYLEDRGFVDDAKLAEGLKRDAVERRHFGKRGVKACLVKRGISGDTADAVAGAEEEYTGTAQRLVEKRLRLLKGCGEETVKRRLWGLLARRGFSPDTIKTVMRSINLKEEL